MSDRLSHEKVWAVLDLFDYACARMGTLDKLLEGSEWEEEPIGNSFRFSRCILVRLDEDGKIKEYVYGPTRCERRDR